MAGGGGVAVAVIFWFIDVTEVDFRILPIVAVIDMDILLSFSVELLTGRFTFSFGASFKNVSFTLQPKEYVYQ